MYKSGNILQKLEVWPTELAKVIGQRVRSLRTECGMTQESLAERAGIHFTQVQRLEQGKANPTLETLMHVAEALKVSLPELVAPEHYGPLPFNQLAMILGHRGAADTRLILDDSPPSNRRAILKG